MSPGRSSAVKFVQDAQGPGEPRCRDGASDLCRAVPVVRVHGTGLGRRPDAYHGYGRGYAADSVLTDSATGWWEFVRSAPDSRLSGLVAGRCGYRERAQTSVRRRLAATSLIPILSKWRK